MWKCEPGATRLLMVCFKIDATDDYVNSRILMHFTDGHAVDSKETDIDLISDSILRQLADLFEWAENWREDIKTTHLLVSHRRADSFMCSIRGHRKDEERTGEFTIPQASIPESIQDAVRTLWDYIQSAYGHVPMQLGLPVQNK